MSKKIHLTTIFSRNSDEEQENNNENGILSPILSTISTFFSSVGQKIRNLESRIKDMRSNEPLPTKPRQKQFQNLYVSEHIGGHSRRHNPVLIQNCQPRFHPITLRSNKRRDSPEKLHSLLFASKFDTIEEVNVNDLSHEESNRPERLKSCSDTVSMPKVDNEIKSKLMITYRKTQEQIETHYYLNNAINKLKGLILKNEPEEYEHPISEEEAVKTVDMALKQTSIMSIVAKPIVYNQNMAKRRFSFHESLSQRKILKKKQKKTQIKSQLKHKYDTNVTIFPTCLNHNRKSLLKHGLDFQGLNQNRKPLIKQRSNLKERLHIQLRQRNKKALPGCINRNRIRKLSRSENALESVLGYSIGEEATKSPQQNTSRRKKNKKLFRCHTMPDLPEYLTFD